MALHTLTGLWLNEKVKPDGTVTKYMGGKNRERVVLAPGQRVMVFRNDSKESSRHPDYNLVVTVDDDQPPATEDRPAWERDSAAEAEHENRHPQGPPRDPHEPELDAIDEAAEIPF